MYIYIYTYVYIYIQLRVPCIYIYNGYILNILWDIIDHFLKSYTAGKCPFKEPCLAEKQVTYHWDRNRLLRTA